MLPSSYYVAKQLERQRLSINVNIAYWAPSRPIEGSSSFSWIPITTCGEFTGTCVVLPLTTLAPSITGRRHALIHISQMGGCHLFQRPQALKIHSFFLPTQTGRKQQSYRGSCKVSTEEVCGWICQQGRLARFWVMFFDCFFFFLLIILTFKSSFLLPT